MEEGGGSRKISDHRKEERGAYMLLPGRSIRERGREERGKQNARGRSMINGGRGKV